MTARLPARQPATGSPAATEPSGGLQGDVAIGQRRGQVGGRSGDDLAAEAPDGGRDAGDVEQGALGRRGPVDGLEVVAVVDRRRASPDR